MTKKELAMRATKGCLTDCVAYFFNIHPHNVPLFIYPNKGWNERLKKFFRERGYDVHWDLIKNAPLKKKGLQLVCGDSLAWADASHCVVYDGGKLVYDPDHPSLWKHGRITHRLVINKV